MRRTVTWLSLGAATALAGWALGRAGIPSAYLFAALLLGIAVALRFPGRLDVAPRVFTGAQAVTGVALGCYVQASALEALADDWLPIALVSAGTLALSLASGVALSRFTGVDDPTAALGTIAGGAAGIVGMARELGADDRLVAFMQYLRVLVVVLVAPLVVVLAFPGHEPGSGAGVAGGPPAFGDAEAWLLTAVLAVAGAVAGRLARLPAATLLGPLILAAALALSGPLGEIRVPGIVQETAFALIGLQIGLRFTRATILAAGRLLVPVLAGIVALIVASFGLAVVLAATTSASLLDAYLATTPGGVYAVLAAAVGAGANTTLIVAVQSLRLLVMVLLAPVAVRAVVRAGQGRRSVPGAAAARVRR